MIDFFIYIRLLCVDYMYAANVYGLNLRLMAKGIRQLEETTNDDK